MEGNVHAMTDLFAQLGLPSEPAEIQAYIDDRAPLDSQIPLDEAPFWSPAQAEFLRLSIQQDADWAGVIDELDGRLRQSAS